MNVLFCTLSEPGYLYPALAVGRELAGRGHTVHVLARPDAGPAVRAAGLTPLLVSADLAVGFAVARWFQDGDRLFQAVLAAARAVRADVLVTSILGHGAVLAGQVLDRPVLVLGFATHIWNHLDTEETDDDLTSTAASAWTGHQAPRDPLDDVVLRRWRTAATLNHFHRLRNRLGLPTRPTGGLRQRPLLADGLLLRSDPALDVPGAELPPGIGQVGPCLWEPPAPPGTGSDLTATPDGSTPLVYVHLGRHFGGESLWPRLNAAFTGSGLRAVVEQGRSPAPTPSPDAAVTVVRRPWMAPLIEQADLVLTNATSAPVLAALSRGRPLVVAPSGSEQPVLATACVRAGVAHRLPPTPGPAIPAALWAALQDQALAEQARQLGARLNQEPAGRRAGDAIEAVLAGASSSRATDPSASAAGASGPSADRTDREPVDSR